MSFVKEFREQSAVIPYRRRKGKAEVLLVTSLDTGRWVLPKGGVEPGMTARKSAEKEAYEEAGIEGVVSKQSLGQYRYAKSERKSGGLCRVEVFSMEVSKELDDWPEKDKRTRSWMSIKDAADSVAEKKLRKIISQFAVAFPGLKFKEKALKAQ